MLIRREHLQKIGKMDERYFLYMEDVDWCRRFWMNGLRVRYVGSAVVRHEAQHKSISLSGGLVSSLRHLAYHLTSLARYMVKWTLPQPQSASVLPFQARSKAEGVSDKTAA